LSRSVGAQCKHMLLLRSKEPGAIDDAAHDSAQAVLNQDDL
jgi:hypothetical protein